MTRHLAWLLLVLPLRAQDLDLLPPPEMPPVDLITPVPLPKLPGLADTALAGTMPSELNMEHQALTFVSDTGGRIDGPIKIRGDDGMEVFANSGSLDLIAKTVTLDGNVRAYRNGIVQIGERAVYHYDTRQLDTTGMRAGIDVALARSGDFRAIPRPAGGYAYVGRDSAITLHDVEEPDYWIQSGKTTVYPGEKIVFRDLNLIAGGRRIFWLPYFSQPLDAQLGYHFLPGARSTWGPYLLNSYGIMLGGEIDPATGEREGDWVRAIFHTDIRTNKGLGLGADFTDTRVPDEREMPGLSLYHTYDFNPDDSRTGAPRTSVPHNRYRASLKHRWTPSESAWENWRFDTNLTLLSDAHYLEDFDHRIYRTDPYPENMLGFFRRDESSLLSFYARIRPNDFYRSDTRLPEIAWDRARRPVFKSRVLHEGTASLAVIGEEPSAIERSSTLGPLAGMTASSPAADQLLNQLDGYQRSLAAQMIALPPGDPRREALETQLLDASYIRFHTYQELSCPITLGKVATLTPRVGMGWSYYGNVKGPIDDFDRLFLHAGLEASTKFSRDYGAVTRHGWGLNGLLHVVQPYANYSVISGDDSLLGGPQVDRITPTTRPQPLDPLRFTATDDLRAWSILRLGARNHLLTRRDSQTFDWLFADTYLDVFFDDPEGSRHFSNLHQDITWQPVPWLRVEANVQMPAFGDGSGFREIASGVSVVPNDRFEYSLVYRWLDGHPYLTNSNFVDLATFTRLTEHWGLGTRHSVEFDDGTLEYQEYSLHRDFGSWIGAVGVSSRDNRFKKEYSLVFSLTLSDFPDFSLPFEVSAE